MTTEQPKTMTVRGIRYVESDAFALPCTQVYGICAHCALVHTDGCMDAVEGAALEAFGGDCMQRDVVYKPAA